MALNDRARIVDVFDRIRDEDQLHRLLDVGHRLARAARRARRAQALAAPHPGRDERPQPAPGRGFRKCAKIAGDTSGNYHPHGEQVVYPDAGAHGAGLGDALPAGGRPGQLRLASTATRPAAMRYTEARLTALAAEMLADLEKNTVDFRPNYDETREEPVGAAGRGAQPARSTAARGSRSAWRPKCRRTTWARSATRSCTSSTSPRRAGADLLEDRQRALTSRPAASSTAPRASATAT